MQYRNRGSGEVLTSSQTKNPPMIHFPEDGRAHVSSLSASVTIQFSIISRKEGGRTEETLVGLQVKNAFSSSTRVTQLAFSAVSIVLARRCFWRSPSRFVHSKLRNLDFPNLLSTSRYNYPPTVPRPWHETIFRINSSTSEKGVFENCTFPNAEIKVAVTNISFFTK